MDLVLSLFGAGVVVGMFVLFVAFVGRDEH